MIFVVFIIFVVVHSVPQLTDSCPLGAVSLECSWCSVSTVRCEWYSGERARMGNPSLVCPPAPPPPLNLQYLVTSELSLCPAPPPRVLTSHRPYSARGHTSGSLRAALSSSCLGDVSRAPSTSRRGRALTTRLDMPSLMAETPCPTQRPHSQLPAACVTRRELFGGFRAE